MIWHTLRGHSRQVDMFRRAVQRDRLAHGFLLVGPPGIGKRKFAQLVAQCLFCTQRTPDQLDACGTCPSCKQVVAGSHPDLLIVERPEGKQELPIDLMIGPPERRGREGLCHDLAMRPMTASRRVAIIDDAHTMNDASANALLKTLEEPPAGAILFLTAPESASILSTIRSRCQPILFSPLSPEDITVLLIEQEIETDHTQAAAIAALCEGSLETAAQLHSPELRAIRASVYRQLAQADFDSLGSSKQFQASLEEQGKDPGTQRKAALWLVRFAADFYRRLLGAGFISSLEEAASVDATLRRFASDDAVALDRWGLMLDRCLEAETQLLESMPVPLCLDAFCHDLGSIGRGALHVV
jgi:DNA polymerase III subunit delta'